MTMDSEQERCAHSRRGLLRRLAAAAGPGAALAAIPAGASVTDPADEAFREWITRIGDFNGGRRPESDDNDPGCPVWEAFVTGPERRIYALPPSMMAAAAIALVEASYAFESGDVVDFDDPSVRVLTCVRPALTGVIGLIAADLIDGGPEPYSDRLLARAIRGREVMPWAA